MKTCDSIHVAAINVSKRALNAFKEGAVTTWSDREFQELMLRTANSPSASGGLSHILSTEGLTIGISCEFHP